MVGRMGLPIFLAVRTTPIADLKRCIGSYHEAWKAAGHPGRGEVALIVPVYVAETAQAAREEPEASMMYFLRSIGEMLATGTTKRAEDGQRLLRISYDEVLKELAVYGAASRGVGVSGGSLAEALRDIVELLAAVGLAGVVARWWSTRAAEAS